MQENKQNQEVELDENHLIQIRKDKLKELQEQGKDPFTFKIIKTITRKIPWIKRCRFKI